MLWDKWEEEAKDINGLSTYPKNRKVEIQAVQPGVGGGWPQHFHLPRLHQATGKAGVEALPPPAEGQPLNNHKCKMQKLESFSPVEEEAFCL